MHARLDALAASSSVGHAEADAVEALGASAARTASGSPTEVASHASRPAMWPKSSAASVTSRVSGPAWSSDEAKAIIP